MHESGQFAIGRPGRLTNPNWRDPAALMALPTAAFLVGRLYKEESGSRRGPALDARFRPWWASTPGDKREVSRIFDRVKPEAFGSLTGRKVRAESAVDQRRCTQDCSFTSLICAPDADRTQNTTLGCDLHGGSSHEKTSDPRNIRASTSTRTSNVRRER